jgi:hypothetical protein
VTELGRRVSRPASFRIRRALLRRLILSFRYQTGEGLGFYRRQRECRSQGDHPSAAEVFWPQPGDARGKPRLLVAGSKVFRPSGEEELKPLRDGLAIKQ